MNPLISGFVYEALSRGVSREDIVRALQQGGWASKEINSALDAFVDSDLPLPVPRKTVSSSPKEAFLFLMLFATLYTAAFALGSVLFNIINLALPQPGEFAQAALVPLRVGIASVIVAFPIFLLMSKIIAGETARNPGQRISPVRRWLTYLTLFVASVSIIADLITLIIRFLEGDITARFMLKVLVVAVLAGSAFIYYLRDLRHDEVAPSAEHRVTRSSRLKLIGLVAAVCIILGFGFWYAGSPAKTRLLVQDDLRVRDLADISRRVQQYYANRGALPNSLADCDVNPGTFIAQKTDRITGIPYVYRTLDATHFEVGATFAMKSESHKPQSLSGPAGRIMQEDAGFWDHGPGFKIFTIDATRKK